MTRISKNFTLDELTASATAKAKGMKFSQVANGEDWARIIDALTGAGADETPADDPSDLPF